MTIHTNNSLKAQDCEFEQWHYQLNDGEKYKLTDGEIQWLDFIKGRYSIYDHLVDNMDFSDTEDGYIYTVDTAGMSQALQDDGIEDKAVMLSNDTALQAIFFYSNINK
tara:strand:- start:85 stop:408 length:324 start_codon:yes stop_codon:yes gene_type:complete